MIKMICLGICRIRDDNSLEKVVMSVSLLALVELSQETIVLQGLLLNVILSWIFFMSFSYFKHKD